MTSWRRAGPFVAYPNDRAVAIRGSGIDMAVVALDVIAWSESSVYLLNGRLPIERMRRMNGWTAARQASLVSAGYWRI